MWGTLRSRFEGSMHVRVTILTTTEAHHSHETMGTSNDKVQLRFHARFHRWLRKETTDDAHSLLVARFQHA